MVFFDVLKCDSTYNWEKKLLIRVNVLKFLHMFFSADNAQLRETIEKLHAILSKRCNFEGIYLTQASFPGSCV